MINDGGPVNDPPYLLETRKVRTKKKNKEKKMRIYRVLSKSAYIAAISSVLLLNGCAPFSEAPVQVETNQIEAKKVNIQQDIVLSGITEPFQEVVISPSVSGNVKSLFVDLGSYVEKGQKLAEMFEGDLAYRVQQAEANVRTTEVQAQIRKIEQQIKLNEIKSNLLEDHSIDFEENKYELANAENVLAESQVHLQRMTVLYEQGAVSQKEMEDAQTKKEQAVINLNKLKQLLDLRNKKALGEKESTKTVAKLEEQSLAVADKLTKIGVEQAKADLEVIRYQYNNLTVQAPINGHITEKNAIIGAPFSPQKPMFVITNLDKLYVSVNVPEAMITRVKMDQDATITFPTLTKTVNGKVVYIAQVANSETQEFPVKVLIDNPNYEIKGGMTAQVSLSK